MLFVFKELVLPTHPSAFENAYLLYVVYVVQHLPEAFSVSWIDS